VRLDCTLDDFLFAHGDDLPFCHFCAKAQRRASSREAQFEVCGSVTLLLPKTLTVSRCCLSSDAGWTVQVSVTWPVQAHFRAVT
jgi:hypothetical protein